jgi:hypothetical protein
MGSSRPRNSTRARKARSAKRTTGRPAADRPATLAKPRIPATVEIAIDDQRDSVGTAISLLYCLHAALRCETAYPAAEESEAIADAAEWADLTDITAMLLLRLHGVHCGLDPVALLHANPDPEMVMLMEEAHKQGIKSNEREAS